VATWIDPMLRHLERLEQLSDRLFVAMAGGATGTFAAMGPLGPEVQDVFARRLRLRAMPVPARNIADPFAELVSALALLSTTGSAIAEEVTRLAAVEFGELAETLPPDDVGSSTMPQKRNAKLCGEIITIGAQTRGLAPLAFEATIHSHEVDGARSAMMDEAVESSLILTGDLLVRLRDVLQGLQVFEDRMKANLCLTGGSIMAEAVMMALADTLGRQHAHQVIHDTVTTVAYTGRDFTEALSQNTTVTSRLTSDQIAVLLDPGTHIGQSSVIALRTAKLTRDTIGNHASCN